MSVMMRGFIICLYDGRTYYMPVMMGGPIICQL